jgi:hypothetical protein
MLCIDIRMHGVGRPSGVLTGGTALQLVNGSMAFIDLLRGKTGTLKMSIHIAGEDIATMGCV